MGISGAKYVGFRIRPSGVGPRQFGMAEWGSDHAKCLNICKKNSKNSWFFVLNVRFWVQNNRPKDYLKNRI
jgi:hypothetical protein